VRGLKAGFLHGLKGTYVRATLLPTRVTARSSAQSPVGDAIAFNETLIMEYDGAKSGGVKGTASKHGDGTTPVRGFDCGRPTHSS
jgi:hypothetical protein